ncbi:serine acetyltransferase [candidate division KSB1 bacterium]|nr:serine acetyltransferase [candidate division KSB1 bacterium]
MFANIGADFKRYYRIQHIPQRSPFWEKLRIFRINPSLHALINYRFLRWVLQRIHHPLLRKVIFFMNLPIACYYKSIWGISIDVEAKIGKGCYIGHYGGIFIGPVEIGENCNLAQNVTIGLGGRGEERGIPKIGNQVWIGVSSVISGKITIGDHTTISAGTILSKSVPDHVTVAGNPGRVILRDTDNDDIIFGTNVHPQDFI